MLFTENETNNERLFPEHPNASPYVKDGINNYVVQGRQDGSEPRHTRGPRPRRTTSRWWVPASRVTVRLRLTNQRPHRPFRAVDVTRPSPLACKEADEFYRSVTPPSVSPDAANVMRQALAGMLWSKQFYFFDADQLAGGTSRPPPPSRQPVLPEIGVVPHGQRGHHLDAGQVGVSLVRGLGPGLPHAAACRSSTPTSRSSRCCSWFKGYTCTPTGRCPPTNGISAT